jgi:hypothetical protein
MNQYEARGYYLTKEIDQSSATGWFGYARAVARQFSIGQTLFGYELRFNFTIEPYPRDQKESVSFDGLGG